MTGKQTSEAQVMRYPAKIEWMEDDKEYLVTFPDLQGCQTFGVNLRHALEMAKEASTGWIAAQYLDDQEIPSPSKRHGKDIYPIEIEAIVAVPIMMREMREAAGMTQVQMAEALGIKQQSYQRWEKPFTNITIKNLEKVAGALGKVVHIEIKSA